MKDKRLFFGCFAKSLLISLLLWGVAMGAMLWVNHQWSWEDIISQRYELPNAITQGTTNFTIPTGSEEEEIQSWERDSLSVMLTMNSCDTLKKYGGQFFVRVYDQEGEQLGQSQMLAGQSAVYQPDGTSELRYLLFDPALTEEGQMAAARILNGYSDHSFWTGEAGDHVGTDKIELTGWEEGEVIYVRTLTLHFGEERVVLADSDAQLFPDREAETFQAVWLECYSALTGRGGPERRLEQYRDMAAQVDAVEADNPRWMLEQSSTVYYGKGNTDLRAYGVHPMAYNYYLPGDYLLAGLEPAALITLGAAVALALFTAWLETRAIRRERAFTRAAAHELKTPLAVLRTHAEALREDIDPAKRGQYLDTVVAESDRMAALVGSLMDLARLESGGKVEREPLDLAALVGNSAARLSLLAEEKNIELRTQLAPASMLGDRLRLEEVVDNLADNALRHCTPGGAVTVSLAQKGRRITLTVDNDGAPIPQKHLDRLFEPFYRGDEGRSRADGGTGLGLAIVRAAVEAHGGRCWAVNRTGGVTFTVVLPGLQSKI